MKTLSPLKAGLFAIIVSSALLTATVSAKPGDDWGGVDNSERAAHSGGMHKMFRGLELTDEQKAEVKKIFAAHKADREEDAPTEQERAAHKAEMLSVITASSFNEAQAKQLLMAQQEKRAQMMLDRLQMQNQIYQLLTPEQQTKYKARFENINRKERRGE